VRKSSPTAYRLIEATTLPSTTTAQVKRIKK
jgi:hypothetical protein